LRAATLKESPYGTTSVITGGITFGIALRITLGITVAQPFRAAPIES
jgi:hypothetical protein